MTDFSDKLRRRFKVEVEPEAGPGGDALSGETAEFLRRRWLRRQAARPTVVLPAGEVCCNAGGEFYKRTLRYPLDTLHGHLRLATAVVVDATRIAALARDTSDEGFELSRCLFLDTETTGLSGGAGTVVFMCGLGWIDTEALTVEQVFLREFADEPGVLRHVAMRLSERPHLVTFVGKSFDRHRLAARMAMHRIESDIVRTRHLDLYHLARRAWGKQLPDVRLRTVEESMLGLRRDDDLPGAEAPAAWLDWLRDGSGPIDRVFEHNRLDVLSLVALLGALGRPVRAGS